MAAALLLLPSSLSSLFAGNRDAKCGTCSNEVHFAAHQVFERWCMMGNKQKGRAALSEARPLA